MNQPTPQGPLAVRAAGITFQNPVVLAAGTAAYGREIAHVVRLDALGALTTKAVFSSYDAFSPIGYGYILA